MTYDLRLGRWQDVLADVECDWLGWQVRIGAGFLDFDDADTAEFIGWRGMP